MTCYEAAKWYLELGLHPIPCAPRSKRPLVEWKPYQEHPPLADEVDEWWTRTPDANVALVLGRGTFAVDLDGGSEAERLLIERGVLLPGAPRSRTADGFHVFLSASGPVPDRVGLLTTAGKKPQVDIRGVGIVVAPPSIHPSGARYEWHIPLTIPFPPAPQSLLELITRGRNDEGRRGAAEGTSWVIDTLRGVSEGQRDDACTRLAGFLLGRGLDELTVRAILVEGFARNCSPPFSPAEVAKCVRSIARKQAATGTAERVVVPVSIASALDDLMATTTSTPPWQVPTPFPSLNGFLDGGFMPGELIYLGARPGVGKTAMGLEIARRAAKLGNAVFVVSREMMTLALARRLLAQEARVSASSLRSGQLGDGERAGVQSTLPQLKKLPIWLTDQAVTFTEIADLVARWSDDQPLRLLIVDYLQLVQAPRDIRERRLQVEAVSQGLKTLALRQQIPVLCLSSLARPTDRKEKRPTLASLRESGELEHDADVVLLLHRESMKADTECIVAKNRDGRQGTAHLQFRREFVSFDEVARRHDD